MQTISSDLTLGGPGGVHTAGLKPAFSITLRNALQSFPGLTSTFTRNSDGTYINTIGEEQTAGVDTPRFQNGRYLAEAAATNLFLQSGTPATQTITVVSGSTYTVQCYGSGSIVLSGAGTGTVVQGTPVTFTAASTTLTCVPSAIDKAQVELGSKATSYIPTTTAPMTRAADVLHYDVSSAITQGQGSLYCEFYNIYINSGASRVLLCLSDGTSSNRFYFQINASNRLTFLVVNDGTTVGYIAGSVSSIVGINKVLFTYADNNMRLYHNGATAGEDLSGIMGTTMIKLSVGCLENSTTQLNREIGNIKYFKEVLTEAEAIKLTTL